MSVRRRAGTAGLATSRVSGSSRVPWPASARGRITMRVVEEHVAGSEPRASHQRRHSHGRTRAGSRRGSSEQSSTRARSLGVASTSTKTPTGASSTVTCAVPIDIPRDTSARGRQAGNRARRAWLRRCRVADRRFELLACLHGPGWTRALDRQQARGRRSRRRRSADPA